MGLRGPGAMNFGLDWNLVEEQLLHNFMKYFSGPWANQMVNKNLSFSASLKMMFTKFLLNKKIDDAFETMTLLINLGLICRF